MTKGALEAQLAEVRATLADTEALRGAWPAGRVETMLASLRAQETALLEEIARGAVGRKKASKASVRGGGAVARGKDAVAAGKQGIAIGGNARDVIVHQGAKDEAPSPKALETAYLRNLAREVGAVSLSGIDPAVPSSDPRERLQLEAVYTALRTQTPAAESRPASRRARANFFDVRATLSALELLDRSPRLVLLGDPGSGKSTLVHFVALCQAGERLGLAEANRQVLTAPLPGEEERQPWRHSKLLPVRVLLRDFAAEGLPAEGEEATAEHLWRFLAAELGKASLGEWAPLLRKRLLEEGGLILLDGLDEVPQARDRRLQICQAVEGFAGTFAKCRFLVTSRTYAYQSQGWRLAGFDEAVLAPFGDEQIDLFVSRWYAHLAALGRLDAKDAEGRAALLSQAIAASERLRELAARPLLLTLMASLHAWRGGSLPERREALYADAVRLLLDLWERQRYKRDAEGKLRLEQPSLAAWLATDQEAVRRVLEDLAFAAHAAQPDLAGTADLAEDRLVGALLRLAKSEEVSERRLIDYLSQRSGLLVARGEGVYTLPHRSFQEYLAACRLTRSTYPAEVAKLARADPDRWREVLLLAAAKAAGGATSGVWALAERLCFREPPEPDGGEPEPADLWGAHLAGQAVVESGALGDLDEAYEPRLALLRRWHLRLIRDGQLAPRERALAGDTLAALGDPRFDPERWGLPREPLLGFVEVPAGPFRMGSDPERDPDSAGSERPEHAVELPTFYLGRWPVTVGQYRAFVAASGYEGHAEWGLVGPPSRPVVGVSFRDALAYAGWLGERLRELARAKAGWESEEERRFWEGLASGRLGVALPSEAEWEKAARGEGGRIYPWGDAYEPGHANDGQAGIGHPSAVGCFPGDVGPYGAEDLAGNVWEWTRSRSGPYPYAPGTGRESAEGDDLRVLRGGAFGLDPGIVRCAVRYGGAPDERSGFIGFRVVVSPFRSGL